MMNEDELERLSSQNSYLLSLYQDKDKQLTILKNYLKQSENRDERTDRADHEHRKRPRSLLVDPFINERFASLQNQIEMYKNKLNKALKDIQEVTFDPQTVNGQKLMRKCKELRDENVKVHTKYQLHRDELAELLNKEKYTRGVLENGVIEACTAASQAHSERERLQSQLLKKQEEIHRLLAEKKEGWKLEKEARKKRRVERDEKRQAEVEALKAAHREEMEVLKLKLAEKEATVSAQSELIRALKQEAEQGKTNQQRGTSNTAMHDDTRDEDGKGVSKEMMEMVAAAVGETKDKEKE